MSLISLNEIVQPGNPFQQANQGAKELIAQREKIIAQTAKLKQSLPKSINNSDDVKKLATAKKQLTDIEKEELRIQKALITNNAKIIKVYSDENKTLEKSKQILSERNKIQKDSVAINRAAANSIEKLRLSTTQLIKQRDQLGNITGKNKKQFQDLTRQISKQQQTLTKYDAQIGRSQRGVGKYAQGIKRAFGQILVAAGVTGLLMKAVQGIKQMVTIGTEFTSTMSKVKAISGASNEEFKALEANAKKLGASTEKTAIQVGQLQVELSKLGFSAPEILKSTEGILNLSTATGEDLAESATVAGATLRGFGLDASEMGRITDVMALSFSSSALDLSKFGNAMPKVAAAAKAMGFTFEESTAMLGTLVDRGFESSVAGTSLRKIFIDLSKSGMTMNEAFDKINNSQNKLQVATKLFGNRAAVAALQLAENAGATENLRVKLEGAEGAAKRMADIMRDNLQGDADKAKSAVEGLALNIFDRLSPALRNITQGFTGVVDSLNDWLKVPVSDEILKEQVSINMLFDQLLKTNPQSEKRLELVQQMQKEYPNYIANIDLNAASEQQLRDELRLTNQEYQNRYIVQIANEKLDKANQKVAEAKIKVFEKQQALEDRVFKVAQKRGLLDKLATKTTAEKWQYLHLEGNAMNALNKANDKLASAQRNLNEVQTEANVIIDGTTPKIKGNTEALDMSTKAQLARTKAEIESLKLENLKRAKTDEEKARYAELLGIRNTLIVKRNEEIKLEKELAQAKLDAENAGDDSGGGGKGKTPKGETDAQKAAKAEKAAMEALRRSKLEGLEKQLDDIDLFYDDLVEKAGTNKDLITEINLARTAALTEANDEYWDKELEQAKKEEELAIKAGEDYLKIKADTREKENEEKLKQAEKDAEFRKQELEAELALGNELFNVYAAFNARKVQAKDTARNEEIAAIDEQLALSLENEALTDEQRESLEKKAADSKIEINKKADEEIAKLKRRQAIADKTQALFNIGIDTARAVMAVTAEATLAAPFLIPAIIGLGVAQAAAVLATPIPEFGEGQIDISGKKHSEGGINAIIEGGESVINAKSTKKSKEALELINQGYLTDDSIFSALSLYSLNLGNKAVDPTIINMDYGQLLYTNNLILKETVRQRELMENEGSWSGKTKYFRNGNRLTQS